MWQADKVKIQHELADSISKIMDIFSNTSPNLLFDWFKSGLNILNKEWNKIDYYRINKFMYLVNKLMTDIMSIIKEKKWTYKLIRNFHQVLDEEIFNEDNQSDGLALHIIDKYIGTLGEFKFNKGKTIENLLQLFISIVSKTNKKNFRTKIIEDIFGRLLEENQKKFECLDLSHLKNTIFEIAKGKDLSPGNRKSVYEIVTMIENDPNYENKQLPKNSEVKKTTVQKELNVLNSEEKSRLKRKRDSSPIKETNQLNGKESPKKQQKKKKTKKIPEELPQKEEEIENLHLEKLPLDEIAIHEKHDSDESFEEDNADYIEGDDFLFDLSCLSKKDLKSLKKLYPNLPEYYFKSQPEKKKYFQQLNKKYYEKLSKEKPKTPSSIPKKVDFNVKLNQIKEFYMADSVILVKNIKMNSNGKKSQKRNF